MKSAVESADAPMAIGPYTQAIASGDLLFISGQIGLDPASGLLVEGAVADEARRAFENVRAVLKAAGLSADCVVKTTLYMTDLADFAIVNQVYAEFFSAPFPARATVQVAALPRGARVEIDAIAVLKGRNQDS